MRIFLIGPGGTGKTTTGKILAERLGFIFIDLDERFIEEKKEVGFIYSLKFDAGTLTFNSEMMAFMPQEVKKVGKPIDFPKFKNNTKLREAVSQYIREKHLRANAFTWTELDRKTRVIMYNVKS